MRLDIIFKTEHTDIANGVVWSPDSQLLSCSDDKIICRWSADGEMLGKITSIGTYCTSLSWFPTAGKQVSDNFAVSCTDGTFRFISGSGREEKKVAAHEGAVIVVKWSRDGTAMISAGEDGDVKVWSRNGNLRSTLASTGQSVYACCWGPDDDQVLIATGKKILISSVQAKRKNVQWEAHDGIILCADWNVANGFIVTGAEDCTYRVWDSFGRQLYCSKILEHVITCVGWSPNGESFAVGSHNSLRLCDKTGWTHCRERLSSTTGSVMSIAWTSDGTQFAGACGGGSILWASVVDRRQEWKNVEITLVEPRKIRVHDAATESLEDLSYPRDRVVEFSVGFDMLIVTTTRQCYIYNVQNLNTPIIIDIRAPPHFIHLCRKHFLTLDAINGLQVNTFEGRVASNPKFQGMRPEFLSREMVSISPDVLVVIDTVDAKVINILDVLSGRPTGINGGRFVHTTDVSAVCLNQHSLGIQDRLVAFVDKNRDLFVSALVASAGQSSGQPALNAAFKLHSHVESFMFNDETDVLVALTDSKFMVWCQPSAPIVDRDMLAHTTVSYDATEYGRNSQIVAYTGGRVSVRKVDGSLLFVSTSPDLDLIYTLGRGNRWDECLRLCRYQRSSALWGTLAVMALAQRELNTLEICLAELNEVAKVEYVQYIKTIPSPEGQQAEIALFRRQVDEAERIFLNANPPLVYRAVKMNIRFYRWSRALDIALKFRTHVDTVLGYRQRFLEQFQKRETDQKFLQYASQVTVDWDAINAKKLKEKEDEASRPQGGSGLGRSNRK